MPAYRRSKRATPKKAATTSRPTSPGAGGKSRARKPKMGKFTVKFKMGGKTAPRTTKFTPGGTVKRPTQKRMSGAGGLAAGLVRGFGKKKKK